MYRRREFIMCRLIAREIEFPSNEIAKLKEEFCDLSGSNLQKLKHLHAEVFSQVNWGRFVLFLCFAEQLGLTSEEWELLFEFLVPTLIQIRE